MELFELVQVVLGQFSNLLCYDRERARKKKKSKESKVPVDCKKRKLNERTYKLTINFYCVGTG